MKTLAQLVGITSTLLWAVPCQTCTSTGPASAVLNDCTSTADVAVPRDDPDSVEGEDPPESGDVDPSDPGLPPAGDG